MKKLILITTLSLTGCVHSAHKPLNGEWVMLPGNHLAWMTLHVQDVPAAELAEINKAAGTMEAARR